MWQDKDRIMTAELGHFALILAFVVAIMQMIIPMIGAQKGWIGWMDMAVPAAILQFALTALSFAALVYAFATSDFSLAVVAENSHSSKEMLYKITGTWGNHEGSMLLWVFILTLFGALVALFGQNLPKALKARVLSVQAAIAVAFFVFILFTSNPFLRLAFPPFDGNGLNPLLQDPGLAFHPPFLYLGYVGFSIAFSFAVAALIGMYILIWRTELGYKIRTLGQNPNAAHYAGISNSRVVIIAMTLSGAIAGMIAVNEVLGVQNRLVLDFVFGYGFVGIAVGLIDGFVYIGTLFQAVLLGYLLPEKGSPEAADIANWKIWPYLMIPVAAVGLILAIRVWNAKPKPSKRHEQA